MKKSKAVTHKTGYLMQLVSTRQSSWEKLDVFKSIGWIGIRKQIAFE